MHRIIVFSVVAVVIALALGALFVAGYGVGAGMTALGLGSWGGILWADGLVIGLTGLALSRGFRQWVSANSVLATAVASAFTAGCAYAHWAETGSVTALWIGRITAIIAIVLFIRYSCRWGNWCAKIGPKWKTKGWPTLKKGWAKAWSRCVAFAKWVEETFVPWLYSVGAYWKPALVKHFWRIAFFLAAGVAYFSLYQEQRDLNQQSWWFWGAVVLAIIFALAGWEDLRKLLGKLFGTCWSIFQEKCEERWKKFKEDTSGWGKALTGTVAVLGLAIVWNLLQEVFQRNSGWLFQSLHINMYAFGRVTWGGVALVAGVFATATVILLLILPYWWKDGKKKPKKLSKEEAAAEKRREADLIKMIRKHRGEEGVAAYKRDKKAGKKFSW